MAGGRGWGRQTVRCDATRATPGRAKRLTASEPTLYETTCPTATDEELMKPWCRKPIVSYANDVVEGYTFGNVLPPSVPHATEPVLSVVLTQSTLSEPVPSGPA